MLCCKVPSIEDFQKPPGVWCRYAAPGKGCTVYDSRPACCRSFYCMWMLDASFGPEWKPERSKFVLYVQRNGENLQVAVDPGFANAWTRPPYYERLKRMATQGAEHGRFVFVRIGERMIAMLPDRDADLGPVKPEDQIFVSRQVGPTGFTYAVEVKRAAAANDRPKPD
jgi:hypothetical protein